MDNKSLEHILWLTTPQDNNSHQQYLMSIAEKFNKIADSDRILIPDYYDCGTIARAIFLSLINLKRNGNDNSNENNIDNKNLDINLHINPEMNLTPEEKDRIRYQFQTETQCIFNTTEIAKKVLQKMKPGVMIIGLKFWLDRKKDYQVGHVWIYEKVDQNTYYLYQSVLGRYTVPDYYQNWGNQVDPFTMLDQIAPILQLKKWNKKAHDLYTDIFKYNINIHSGKTIEPELIFTYIEY